MNQPVPNPVLRLVERGFAPVPVVSAAPTDSPNTTDDIAVLRAVISGGSVFIYAFTPTTGWVSVELA